MTDQPEGGAGGTAGAAPTERNGQQIGGGPRITRARHRDVPVDTAVELAGWAIKAMTRAGFDLDGAHISIEPPGSARAAIEADRQAAPSAGPDPLDGPDLLDGGAGGR